MIPEFIRYAIVGIGVLSLFGSWFVGSTVDEGHVPAPSERGAFLQRDALTMSLRVLGAFMIIVGLLTWVVAHPGPIF